MHSNTFEPIDESLNTTDSVIETSAAFLNVHYTGEPTGGYDASTR